MNTGKQINAMVLMLFVLAVVAGVYALWDEHRAENAEADQLELTAERGATTYALNCRLCHGDRGEGGVAGGRLPQAFPLNTEALRGIQDGQFSFDAFEDAFNRVSHTITCGRVGKFMPTWGQSQGGTLNEEQIRQLTVLITGGDPRLGLHEEEGFWDLAQEHADELDAEATQHAAVAMPDGTFNADETELIVTNAAPFSPGMYIRIQEERLRVQPKGLIVTRGVGGTEVAEHEVGAAIQRIEAGDAVDTGETLSELAGDDPEGDTLLEVSEVRHFATGDVLQIDDERVRVEEVLNGVPTTYQTLVQDVGREPDELILSGAQGFEVGDVVRLDAELMRVREIRDDADIGITLNGDISASDERISVSDASIFQEDYVVRLNDELVRVIGQVDTHQVISQQIGRAETSFEVSGTAGLREGMVIRMGTELMRIREVTPARIEVQREGPAAHTAGTAIELADAAEGEETETGQTLLESVGTDETSFVISGTSGITEGDSYLIDSEQVTVRRLQPARLRVERAVEGSDVATHSSRVPIFAGNLIDVERGFGGTSAAAHDGGTPVRFTEIVVQREFDGSELQDHSRGAEVFLGNRLIVDRGVAVGAASSPTEPADHANGELVMAFPEAPEPERNLGEACGLVAQPETTPAEGEEPTPTPGGTPAEGAVVNVSLTEFAISPDPQSVPAGPVTFQVSNDGTIDHNLRVIATDLAADALPTSGPGVDEGSPDIEVLASTPDFGGGESQTLSVTLEPATYVLICNFPGHYASGMFTTFEVTE